MRRRLRHLATFTLAALAGGTGLGACERPENLAASTPERYSPAPAPAPAPLDTPVGAEVASNPEQQRLDAQETRASRPALAEGLLTDTAITSRIKAAILSDPRMAGADVSVNTDRGVVMLAGTVKSHEQTGIASAHAQSEDGVMRVDNHLAVGLS